MDVVTPDWVKDAIFYQIFPDRFAKSDRVLKSGFKLESWDSPPTVHGFKGGDLFGISEHLDYLQDLGINAIYLNPIAASASNHRYHTYDYFHVDPLLGGDKAFEELISRAHSRRIRIILDGVFNHASRGFWQFHHVLENGTGSPYVNWFHFNPDFLTGKYQWGAYPSSDQQAMLANGKSSYETLGYQAWWNLPALPKFNTSTEEVREFLLTVAVYWIERGADGWRLDVPTDIDDDHFWREFRKRVKSVNPNAYIVGEVWHEAQRWLQGDQFDAVMNYLLSGALMGWLINDRLPYSIFNVGDYKKYLHPINAEEFANRIDYLLGLYHNEINFSQLNILSSHDTPRFLTTAKNDESTLKLAWLFIFTFIGAPCIYYGDEIGMVGEKDPDCRSSFNWDKSYWKEGIYGYAKSLIKLRSEHSVLRRGRFQQLYVDNNVFAYARLDDKDIIIVIINTNTYPTNIRIPIPPEFISSKFITVFGDAKDVLHQGSELLVSVFPRSGIALSAKLAR